MRKELLNELGLRRKGLRTNASVTNGRSTLQTWEHLRWLPASIQVPLVIVHHSQTPDQTHPHHLPRCHEGKVRRLEVLQEFHQLQLITLQVSQWAVARTILMSDKHDEQESRQVQEAVEVVEAEAVEVVAAVAMEAIAAIVGMEVEGLQVLLHGVEVETHLEVEVDRQDIHTPQEGEQDHHQDLHLTQERLMLFHRRNLFRSSQS